MGKILPHLVENSVKPNMKKNTVLKYNRRRNDIDVIFSVKEFM